LELISIDLHFWRSRIRLIYLKDLILRVMILITATSHLMEVVLKKVELQQMIPILDGTLTTLLKPSQMHMSNNDRYTEFLSQRAVLINCTYE